MSFASQVDRYLRSQHFLVSASDQSLYSNAWFCPVCHGEKNAQYELCYMCNEHRKAALVQQCRLADRTGFVCYGDHKGRDQFGSDMYAYKASSAGLNEARGRIRSVLYHTLYHYYEDLCGPEPIALITSVPSTKNAQRNELFSLVETVARKLGIEDLVRPTLTSNIYHGNTRREDRNLDSSMFSCAKVSGHVLVIEDSWVTGSNAQSAAAAVHAAGASYVTLLAVARMVASDTLRRVSCPFIPGGVPHQSPFCTEQIQPPPHVLGGGS